VLISGSGTNLQAIIDTINDGALDATIGIVISSRPDAYGLVRAQEAGIPTYALSKDAYANPLEADALIVEKLQEAECSHVVMAGYMRMVNKPILQAFPHAVINIHPALLPAFTGAHAIEDAYKSGVKVAGVTIHFANELYDKGPIIAQQAVEVSQNDSLEDLETKIHAVEHRLYPKVLQLVAENRVHVASNGVVMIDDK
ncbi:MAG: phosphoribosylglycinamide formyltransferase, partial [Eggerthellaceae bacterium]|nr:phosphoribosylglycinamide formyltransferase [Eggerthellaceae bacterium]